MRWLRKPKPPAPAVLDTRERLRFALFPRRLDDGWTVWLEGYWVKEVWTKFYLRGYEAWKEVDTWSIPPFKGRRGLI